MTEVLLEKVISESPDTLPRSSRPVIVIRLKRAPAPLTTPDHLTPQILIHPICTSTDDIRGL